MHTVRRSPAGASRTPILVRTLLGAVALLLASTASAERHELDPAHTAVGFLIGHVGYSKVLGRFSDVAGGFDYDETTRTLSDLVITVQTASVDTDDEARDEHVRKPDFLSAERHPEMIFRVESAVLDSADRGPVEGTLELLGTSLPLTLEVKLNKAADYPFGHGLYTYGISARGTLDRSDYGMDYGVADGLVADEVELIVEAEAPRAR